MKLRNLIASAVTYLLLFTTLACNATSPSAGNKNHRGNHKNNAGSSNGSSAYKPPVNDAPVTSTNIPTQVQDAPGQTARIKGLHLATKWRGSLDDDALKNPDISSVTLYGYWSDLNPSKGNYDWSRLDGELSRYVAAGKNVGLMYAAGERSPEWIYNEGVRHFTITEFKHHGKGKEFSHEQPVVYDKAYVDFFTKFVRDLAAHMKTQKYWSKLTHVSLTGVNITTAELRLPAQENMEVGGRQSTDAVALWKANDYTPEKVIETFKTITTAVGESFPNRLLIVPIISIPANAFPAIGNTNVSMECLKWLKKTYPDRAAAQFTSLLPDYSPKGFITDVMKLGIPVGYELNEGKLKESDDENAFDKSIEAGVRANALYIEVFPQNAVKFKESVKRMAPGVQRKD